MTLEVEITKTPKRYQDWPEWFKEVKANIQSLRLEDVIKFPADGTWTELPLDMPPLHRAPRIYTDDGGRISEYKTTAMMHQREL